MNPFGSKNTSELWKLGKLIGTKDLIEKENSSENIDSLTLPTVWKAKAVLSPVLALQSSSEVVQAKSPFLAKTEVTRKKTTKSPTAALESIICTTWHNQLRAYFACVVDQVNWPLFWYNRILVSTVQSKVSGFDGSLKDRKGEFFTLQWDDTVEPAFQVIDTTEFNKFIATQVNTQKALYTKIMNTSKPDRIETDFDDEISLWAMVHDIGVHKVVYPHLWYLNLKWEWNYEGISL